MNQTLQHAYKNTHMLLLSDIKSNSSLSLIITNRNRSDTLLISVYVSCLLMYFLHIVIVLTKLLLIFTWMCVRLSESNLAEPGLWHAAGPPGHLSVLLRGEDMGRTGGTVPAPHRMEGQSGWPQIHRTAGQQPNTLK